MRMFTLSMVASAIFASAATAQVEPRTSEISSSGRGEVRVTPNKAVLVVIVENRAPLASDAASLTAGGVASTIAALKAAGAAANQITNGGYSVTQDYETDRNTRKPKGFIARNPIRIEVVDIANVGKFIDTALASGSTQISPIQFSAANHGEARREALALAVAEARRDAEALAAAAGGGLGRLLTMTTGPSQPMYRGDYDVVVTAASGSATPTTIAPNDLVISGIVSARWEFVPRR